MLSKKESTWDKLGKYNQHAKCYILKKANKADRPITDMLSTEESTCDKLGKYNQYAIYRRKPLQNSSHATEDCKLGKYN